MRIGIDVGGTFTDVVCVDEDTGTFHCIKHPTTHNDLADGVIKGLKTILEISGFSIHRTDHLIHGTTIGTNAIVEGNGARVGLITTAGFEDVLEIRRVARPKEAAFDFGADNPPPLVPKYLRKGVTERMNCDGEVLIPLDEGSLAEIADFFIRHGVEAVVVSLLFSFLNPLHEQRVAEIIRRWMPGAQISLSSDICPEFREYERTCTTVMNGYLGPVIKQYMENLTNRLEKRFGQVSLDIMQSSGGTMTADIAKNHAAHLINSGPAGGAIAAAFISQLTGDEMAVGADMGGTTFDISIIDKGVPKTTTWGGVTNYPIKLPMVDLKTIGAGGGSIAWVDDGGLLHVGPQSAGSNPGPACYGWGGRLPTVSDANLILGRLNPDFFLGGKFPLYPERARIALKNQVADKIGLSIEEAAAGIIRIVNANMAKGISGISTERGYDLREFALITMGGAAALHAAEIANDLAMARIIVPPMCGNFSAVGLVVADIQHDYVRTFVKKELDIDPSELKARFIEMETEGLQQLAAKKAHYEHIIVLWSADIRYEGQSWELNIPIKRSATFTKKHIKKILEDFNTIHHKVYSYSETNEPVEFVNLRVRVVGKKSSLKLSKTNHIGPSNPIHSNRKRNVYFAAPGWIEVPIFSRSDLRAGNQLMGPCIIEEPLSTSLIPPGFSATIDHYKNIVITAETPHAR